MARSVWKGQAEIESKNNKTKRIKWRIWSRRSSILPEFVGCYAEIYIGKVFVRSKITNEKVGHKFGEFPNAGQQGQSSAIARRLSHFKEITGLWASLLRYGGFTLLSYQIAKGMPFFFGMVILFTTGNPYQLAIPTFQCIIARCMGGALWMNNPPYEDQAGRPPRGRRGGARGPRGGGAAGRRRRSTILEKAICRFLEESEEAAPRPAEGHPQQVPQAAPQQQPRQEVRNLPPQQQAGPQGELPPQQQAGGAAANDPIHEWDLNEPPQGRAANDHPQPSHNWDLNEFPLDTTFNP